MNRFAEITKKAGKTFYYSSLLFPRKVRDEVMVLYAYVRVVDDYIDSDPPKYNEFQKIYKQTVKALKSGKSGYFLVDEFIKMVKENGIEKKHIDDFFASQEIDYRKNSYLTFKDLEKFVYGVAEVIGLMMAKITDVDPKGEKYAKLLGKGMQIVNVIRDIGSDFGRGKVYIPQEDLKRYGLKSVIPLNEAEEKRFSEMVRYQIERFFSINSEARKGFRFIPHNNLFAIKTADDIYLSTAKKIYQNPLSVLKKKVKPNIINIAIAVVRNYFIISLRRPRVYPRESIRPNKYAI